MKTKLLGMQGLRVSAIGLGCMGMSGSYGPADRNESLETVHAALDAGITLLDTGDFYGSGHNELLIREAIRDRRRDEILLSVKFGALRDPDGGWHGQDGRPGAVRNFLAFTLQRLGTDYVDIYRPSRLDPAVPIEETVGAIADMVKAGHVRHIGLSEVGVNTLRRASAVHPILDLQIEYSLFSRGIEKEILSACRELGIGVTAYGVLSRGLISSRWSRGREVQGDARKRSPRFAPGNLERNLALVASLRTLADEKGASAAQMAIAWVASQGDDIVPVIGARTVDQLRESLGARHLALTPGDLTRIEEAVPRGSAVGERYAPQLMAHLDSERRES